MGAIAGLFLDEGVQKGVQDDDLVRRDEVQTSVARLEQDEHELAVRIVSEVDHGVVHFLDLPNVVQSQHDLLTFLSICRCRVSISRSDD